LSGKVAQRRAAARPCRRVSAGQSLAQILPGVGALPTKSRRNRPHVTASTPILRSWCPCSRHNINPHARTFPIAPASAANTSGFLQTSLSKILGNTHSAFTCTGLAEHFRWTL